jgi:hypothetical protein
VGKTGLSGPLSSFIKIFALESTNSGDEADEARSRLVRSARRWSRVDPVGLDQEECRHQRNGKQR